MSGGPLSRLLAVPEPGQVVRVRSRQYLVEAVVPPPEPRHQTLVRLSCLDDDAQGQKLEAPIPLSGEPWFEALVREQTNFSFGFNEIRDAGVVAGLARLARPAEVDVQTSAPADVSIEAEVPTVASAPQATDNAARVTRWLRQRRGNYYCQHCISRETGVTPIAQVNQIVRPLQQAPKEWRYGHAPCSGCGRERKCIAYVG